MFIQLPKALIPPPLWGAKTVCCLFAVHFQSKADVEKCKTECRNKWGGWTVLVCRHDSDLSQTPFDDFRLDFTKYRKT